MDPTIIVALLALGAFTGLAAGLLGIGGGMMLVPFMTVVLESVGFPSGEVVKVAIATSLTSIVFTSASSVRAHHQRGAVRWDVVRALAPGILVGALLAAQLAGALPGQALGAAFGVFLGWSAIRMLRRPPAMAPRAMPRAPGMFATGIGIGALSAVLGGGGGFMTVPFLSRRGVSIQQAIATSAACGFPIALAGTLGYLWAGRGVALPPHTLGYVYWPALAAVSASSMLTAPWGARTAHALPRRTLELAFAALLGALAAYMVWRSVGR